VIDEMIVDRRGDLDRNAGKAGVRTQIEGHPGKNAGSAGVRMNMNCARAVRHESRSLRTTATACADVPREQDGRTVLVLDDGQHEYVFERAK
jgi:hypothetical protein